MPAHASICSHMLAYASICYHTLAYASICWHMPARGSNWLWLKPRIRMPGEIPGDSSHDPNWLWLLAISNSRSHRMAEYKWGGSVLAVVVKLAGAAVFAFWLPRYAKNHSQTPTNTQGTLNYMKLRQIT